MLRGQGLHAVESEEELEIHQLLGPECAVVIEGSDALGDRDEIRRAFFRDALDEGDNGLLRRGVVLRWQRVCLGVRPYEREQHGAESQSQCTAYSKIRSI